MLTSAEIDLLRSLPRRLGAQPGAKATKAQLAEIARRRRLQNRGLLTLQAEPDSGVFLMMITPAGVAALDGAR